MTTIVAIATGPGRGGIGVLRVSGPAALKAVRLVAPGLPPEPEARRAYFSRFVDADQRTLDEGLVLYFAAPASYTGEEVVELQAHGAPRLLSLLLNRVLAQGEVRLAEPGEFTRRAFMNGRLDLARAEAVADLVAAESEAAVRAAAAQLEGGLSKRVAAVREPLTALRADLEASLDFPDEGEGAEAGAAAKLDAALSALRLLEADGRRGALVRRGAKVVLYGPVNAGKSTLFNRLVGEGRALVDPEPGTTRDALEARLELQGLGVLLLDTAGLRDGAGRLEAMGIARTREALAQADVAVLLVPPGATPAEVRAWRAEVPAERRLDVAAKADLRRGAEPADAGETQQLGAGEVAKLRALTADVQLGESTSPGSVVALGDDVIAVQRGRAADDGWRVDVPQHRQVSGAHDAWRAEPLGELRFEASSDAAPKPSPAVGRGSDAESTMMDLAVSGQTGAGVEALRTAIAARLGGGSAGAVAVAAERHLDALHRAVEALERARLALDVSTIEVVSGEVGLALAALSDITGEDVSASLLDEIFKRFCIGK